MHRAGELAGHLSEMQKARALAEQSLALARQANDRWNTAWALACLGYFVEADIHPERATALLEESLALFREIDDVMGINHVLRRWAHIALMQKDYAACPHAERSSAARHSGSR